jgi:hypothetical protein
MALVTDAAAGAPRFARIGVACVVPPVFRVVQIAEGLPGVLVEILSKLKNELTADELPQAVEHICQYLQPSIHPGQDMWITYKRRFDQDLLKFIQGIDTEPKRRKVYSWLWEYRRAEHSRTAPAPPEPRPEPEPEAKAEAVPQTSSAETSRCSHRIMSRRQSRRCKRRVAKPYETCVQHRTPEAQIIN